MSAPARLARLAAVLLALLVAAPGALRGQAAAPHASDAPAVLVADEIRLTADAQLIATGNVEVLHEGRRLQASAITYDRAGESLRIAGPVTLRGPDGILVLAEGGEIDRALRDGILRGARLVMDAQLQLAAHEMTRVDGRYSQLYKATVSSCRVCGNGSPPLWQIRAERVIHDQQARQLYFRNAQLRVLDVPVFYLPRLRLPDPTLKRSAGFLTPSVHNSSLFGTGVRVPYFIPMGDHRDLTVAPFWATSSRRLDLRYRQAFRRGRIEFNGAVADDDFSPEARRGYLFGEGRFDLPRDFTLGFNIEAVSDDNFLLDHEISDKDRLRSGIAVGRARRDELIEGRFNNFRSLRPDEDNATLPSLVGDMEYRRRVFPRALGGELLLASEAHGHRRTSDLTVDGPDFDRFADGRDVARLTLAADWRRTWTLPRGIRASLHAGLALDHFEIAQSGATSASEATEVTPSTALHLRWPWIKAGPRGVAHVIEPALQLAWVGGSNPDVPNDESTMVEFDEGNLFAISRFAAPDRRERELTGALGLSYTRIDPAGWQGSLALGKVIRDDRLIESDGVTPTFSRSSGLRERNSDLLIAGQFRSDNGLTLTARGLFDDALDTSKTEARASWQNARADFGATYIWLDNDPQEDRSETISEVALDGSYRISRHWTGRARYRYDVESDRNVSAGLGVSYTNECVEVGLSASRRFTSSTTLEPSTNVNLIIAIRGFSTQTRDKSYVRTCRNRAE